MFRPISSQVNFPTLEEKILSFWREEGVFEKSLEYRKDAPSFILYEGPPTANGSPGLHHVLARVFKDVIPRYKTMKGYYALRKAGWDCHGLPVELEVERELNLSSKVEIEEYGIERFNTHCRESVFRYLKDWEDLTERIAFWINMKDPYITLDNDYIESCWWIIKELWERKLIYQGHKVTPHCPRCGTSLSSHEVALGYKEDAVDPSVYVKFRFSPSEEYKPHPQSLSFLSLNQPVYFLAWTTTPWTLPGNTALAIAPEAEYIMVEGKGEKFILAAALVEQAGIQGRTVAKFEGKELIGLGYEPLFPPQGIEVRRFRLHLLEKIEGTPSTFPIIGADFVSLEEGTGIVHIAPAFGEVDYEVGKANSLFFLQPVDLQGKVIGQYPFSGLFVKEADPLIIQHLEARGLLYRWGKIVHTYPFCWRCDSPLLYYAKRSWYIKTTDLKDKLIQANEEINWYPSHIKHGRFGDWLQNNVDWALSRERYWGTPLPIWQCQSCEYHECIGSLQELRSKPQLEGYEEGLDLHRPFIDKVSFRCPRCQGRMFRLPEVIDCWFDSGAMPIAQWHYPFGDRDVFKKSFPADYICEAVDQTRGWFYTLHAISTLLFSQPCFKNVICLGHILDAKGEKMSKAKGNVVDPWWVINSNSADALRWYMLTATLPGNVRRFDVNQVKQVLRRFLLTLWNTYSFFVIYANIDRFDPSSPPPAYRSELDRWIISKLNLLIQEVTTLLDNYDPTSAGRKIEEFVEDLSNWYVRRSRRRFWKSENDEDKQAAYFTLYHCLTTLCKLLAPFTPFIAEEMYQNLVRSVEPHAPLSVHLTDFPIADLAQIDHDLISSTHLAMKISSLGRAARSQTKIKVRQPLSQVLIKVKSKGEKEDLAPLASQVLDELNVKDLGFMEDEEQIRGNPDYSIAEEGGYVVAVNIKLSPELLAEGKAREIVHRLQTMRRSAGFNIADYIVTYYETSTSLKQVMLDFAPYIKQETLSRELLEGVPQEAYKEKHRIADEEILLGVKKLI